MNYWRINRWEDLIYHGKIQAKQRPRFNGKFAYTPKETVNYENWVKACYIEKYNNEKPFEKALKVNIIATFEPPRSISNKKRKELIEEKKGYTKKKDVDNISKIILDGLNKLAYKDDAQVVELYIKKEYGENDNVYVEIEEVF